MNTRLKLKERKLQILQWVIIVLLAGISQFYQGQLNKSWAAEISLYPCVLPTLDAFCNEVYRFNNDSAETVGDAVDDRFQSLRVIKKVAVKDEEIHYIPIVIKAAIKHQIDPAVIMAIIMVESGFNPRAVSKKGAKGLMQLMPPTAKALGVKNPFNPTDNINGGVKYFKRKLNKFNGNVKLALAAYNAGSRNVKKYKGIPPFRATKIYVKKVLEYYRVYKNHFFEAEG